MANQELQVGKILVTTRTQASPSGGGLQKVFVVTYHIGDHGPFEDVYAPADYTADKVRGAIQKQLDTLRQISQIQIG
jgi:hypothetical protein